MKQIHELLGMAVVTVQEGTRLGRLAGVEIDTAEGRIRYLHVDAEGRRADGVVPWDAVRSIGADVVTVGSAADLRETVPAAEQDGLATRLGDRPVVTESGSRIGTIVDYRVDPATGRIDGYCVRTGGGILGRLTAHDVEVPHETVLAFGKDAIIVTDPVAGEQAA